MVDRNCVLQHIKDTYSIESVHLWLQYPDIEVFRHEMNKKHWISIILNGVAPDALIFELIDISYNLTRK